MIDFGTRNALAGAEHVPVLRQSLVLPAAAVAVLSLSSLSDASAPTSHAQATTTVAGQPVPTLAGASWTSGHEFSFHLSNLTGETTDVNGWVVREAAKGTRQTVTLSVRCQYGLGSISGVLSEDTKVHGQWVSAYRLPLAIPCSSDPTLYIVAKETATNAVPRGAKTTVRDSVDYRTTNRNVDVSGTVTFG